MIFRLSEKLNAKIKAGTLATLPLDENPFADLSAGLFLVGRSQYILVTNTKSLYSTVLPVRGGERFLRGVFEPLGYEVQAVRFPLDERFPDWGESPYFSVTVGKTTTLTEL